MSNASVSIQVAVENRKAMVMLFGILHGRCDSLFSSLKDAVGFNYKVLKFTPLKKVLNIRK